MSKFKAFLFWSFGLVSDFACLRPARRGYAQAGASDFGFSQTLSIGRVSLNGFETLIYEKKGHIAHVTLNRPQSLDAERSL